MGNFIQNKQLVKSLVGKQGQLFDKVRSQLKKLHQTSADFDNNKMEEYFRNISKQIIDFTDTVDFNAHIDSIICWSCELDELYNKLEGLANQNERLEKERDGKSLMEKVMTNEKIGVERSHFSGSGSHGSPAHFASGTPPNSLGKKLTKINNSGGLNAQALKVWSRVQAKLEDLDGLKSVDKLIAEATDKRNLSRLYEGWTSWV